MEERGEVLDLPAAGAELELAATVDRDSLRGAVVVRVEEPFDAAEPRRLEVERPRREREARDVHNGVDGCIPRDPRPMRFENGIRLVVQRRILQPRLREGQRNARVEGRIRRLVDRCALVRALEVERVYGAGLDKLRDNRVVPCGRRVELDAQVGIEVEPGAQRRNRRGVAEAHGSDEAERLGLALERLRERRPRLP